ncbi:uncharacterized protein LOC132583222 [Heteronotia binoei]|uniref:uncharacterized protein LOC132583222 n=1 Tax=Heteronotia binoei TaxID=13085 RepID=UPI00292F5AE7|nr:uncharacterized protein LOC132583222 [Heteronotia binoei]
MSEANERRHTAPRNIKQKMPMFIKLQHQEVREEEVALQGSLQEVLEGATEESLVCDTQEEFCPVPSESPEGNLECSANELQHQEVREEEVALQGSLQDVLEGATEESLVCDTQEELCPLPSESPEGNLECSANESQDIDRRQQEEQEEEEASQDSRNVVEEGAVDDPLLSSSPEESSPSPDEQHKVPLEVIVNVVTSVYSQDSDGQVTESPQTPRPESPDGDYLAQESCYLTDREDLHQDSGASTGYFPCYLTYSNLPPYQSESDDELPDPPASPEASLQVEGTLQDKASEKEGGVEGSPRGEEAKSPAVAKTGEPTPSAPSCPSAAPTSRRSVTNFFQWVRNVFSRSSLRSQQRSPAARGERQRKNIGTRLRGWIRKHRGRVHPDNC